MQNQYKSALISNMINSQNHLLDFFLASVPWIIAICLHSLAIYVAFRGPDVPHPLLLNAQMPSRSRLSISRKTAPVHCKYHIIHRKQFCRALRFPPRSSSFPFFFFEAARPSTKILIKSKFEINKMFVISQIYCNRRAANSEN